MTVFAADVSYFQKPVDNTYPRNWLIFRCCDGDFVDPHCDHNAAWAASAQRTGRLKGWTAYVVYRPGKNQAVINNVAMLPYGGHVMVDVESWRGEIRGDHSPEINELVAALSKTHPGKVWAYGNRSDLASIYPNRGDIPVVVASYGATKPNVPNMIGWQYTDGSWAIPGKPNTSAPFGPCDHNELYVDTETTDSGSAIPIGETMSSTEYTQLAAKIDSLSKLVQSLPTQIHNDNAGTQQRVVQVLDVVSGDQIPVRSAQYLSGGLPLPGAGHNIPGAETVITNAVKAQVDTAVQTLLAAIAAHTTTITAGGTVDLAPITAELAALSKHLGVGTA